MSVSIFQFIANLQHHTPPEGNPSHEEIQYSTHLYTRTSVPSVPPKTWRCGDFCRGSHALTVYKICREKWDKMDKTPASGVDKTYKNHGRVLKTRNIYSFAVFIRGSFGSTQATESKKVLQLNCLRLRRRKTMGFFWCVQTNPNIYGGFLSPRGTPSSHPFRTMGLMGFSTKKTIQLFGYPYFRKP